MINNHRITVVAAFLCVMFLAGCATTRGEDPLRNTRKLVAEGHASLYNNGAFEVPNTTVRIIPPAPPATQFALELMGVRARQSLELSLKNAAQSVEIVAEGARTTYRWGREVHEGTDAAVKAIQDMTRKNSTLLVYRSTELGKSIIGGAWDASKQLVQGSNESTARMIRESRRAGNEILDSGSAKGDRIAAGSRETAGLLSRTSIERAGDDFSFAGRHFVQGYAAVPANVRQRMRSMGETLDKMNPIVVAKEDAERRKKWSLSSVDLMSRTVKGYRADVGEVFEKAGKELENYRTTGLTLSTLKSLRWVLKGLFWDATIEPVAKITSASLGYIGVNLVAYPAMVVVREGAATTELAVKAAWNAARTAIDVVAPTGIAALAGTLGMVDLTGSHIAAAAFGAGGMAAGYGAKAASAVAGVMVKGGGYAAGKGVQYIGVPLASAGIVLGGGTIGTAVGATSAATGATLYVTGETAAAGAYVFGNTLAGTTIAGGAAASASAGAAYGVYELSKAVAVPAGYELGGGIVLSYESASQIAAHSILAASDCAYLVLSLEGPRWVIYAVKGNLNDGADLPAGAILDLRQMQQQGEDIYNLPVSDGEMKKVVETLYETLPEDRSEGTAPALSPEGNK